VLDREFGGVAALADKFAFERNPRAALFENLMLEAEVEQRARGGNAFVEHDVEFGFGERRSDLVLNNFDLGAVAHNFAVGRLDLIAAADVDAHAGEELERATTGGRLGIAEHHADLFANL